MEEVVFILGLVATAMALLLYSQIVELDTNLSFSPSIPKFSTTSLIIISKGSNALTELDNATYSECSVERAISIYSFDTHNRGQLAKFTKNPVLLLAHIGS